jgi:sugar lactone lactonase YvrE
MELYAAGDPPAGDCCSPAPAVLEYDPAGNLLRHWGGPGAGYDWPAWVHSISVDGKGNVWIAGGSDSGLPPEPGRGGGRGGSGRGGGRGGSGRGSGGRGGAAAARGGVILKFKPDGKFLMKIGDLNANANSNDTSNLKGPAGMAFDNAANELYVADGYGARRVIVFDADTGAFRRLWGAYGVKPDDADPGKYDPAAQAAKQFASPVRCVQLANDGTVYVCDPVNDRIQVFKKDGTFLKEAFIQKKTLGDGSVWQIGFSRDPQQKFLYVADGSNDKVRILNRSTLETEANFGDGGRQPGGFYGVSGVATDSRGNLYTVEAYRGNRVQRFVYKGLGTVNKEDEGYLWPKR